ncbi:MAG: hypothetical protein COB17_00355 [Sulfurimonas sp.]|nr:MAG: hypothetical protein COB17_00355 [Sulfurimonas sp.]
MKFFLMILCLFTLSQGQVIKKSGTILVNGNVLKKDGVIKQGDTIEVKEKSVIRFNIGKDAFKARANTKFKLQTVGKTRVLNIINGSVMAVFGAGKHAISTPNMTVGIRGTGTFTQVRDGKTYFCTCYGHTSVDALNKITELTATYHNMIWITKTKVKQTMDMLGHRDMELRELEAMVGRKVPFDHGK